MIRFRKLYEKLPEHGITPYAIVVYGKRPHLMKTHMEISPNGAPRPEQYVAQYEKGLSIDCWLFTVRLRWYTREKTID